MKTRILCVFFYWRGIRRGGDMQNNQMKKKCTTFEKCAYVLLALSVTCLVLVNFVFKDYLNADAVSANENGLVLLKNSTLYRQQYSIKLAVSDEGAVILINGEAAAAETDGAGYLTFAVYESDVVHIDLTAVPEETVTVFVADTSAEVSSPPKGTKLILKGGIIKIFTIECVKD
jgi:hypothetical protein